MKGFRFRLESVLSVRRHALERRRVELEKARAALRSATRLRAAATEMLRVAQEMRAERIRAGIPAGELLQREHGIEHALGQVAQAEGAVRTAETSTATALAAVTSARREVRALEILREKALAEHRRELARREQAELDEVAGRVRSLGASW